MIFAGGPTATSNPEPFAAFFDFVVLGDGEEVLPEIGLVVAEAKAAGLSRRELLIDLAQVPGVYVPSLYRLAADGPGSTPLQGFTAVVSNSLLHHLHDPQVLWRSVAQLAGPGACVYIKDLRRPASAHAALELQRLHLADAPVVLQNDYIASLHAAFTPEEVELQLQEAGLADQLQVAALEDRYLEVWGQLF